MGKDVQFHESAALDQDGGAATLRRSGKAHRTFMISTCYNRFNAMQASLPNTLSCPANTLWACCHRAPCMQDDRAPAVATARH